MLSENLNSPHSWAFLHKNPLSDQSSRVSSKTERQLLLFITNGLDNEKNQFAVGDVKFFPLIIFKNNLHSWKGTNCVTSLTMSSLNTTWPVIVSPP